MFNAKLTDPIRTCWTCFGDALQAVSAEEPPAEETSAQSSEHEANHEIAPNYECNWQTSWPFSSFLNLLVIVSKGSWQFGCSVTTGLAAWRVPIYNSAFFFAVLKEACMKKIGE